MVAASRRCSMQPSPVTSANIAVSYISLKTRFFRLHFVAESIGVSPITFTLWAPIKLSNFSEITH